MLEVPKTERFGSHASSIEGHQDFLWDILININSIFLLMNINIYSIVCSLHLCLYIKHIISKFNQYKDTTEIFCIPYFALSLENLMCI